MAEELRTAGCPPTAEAHRPPACRPVAERGAGTVLALLVVAVVVTAAWACLVLAAAVAARHRAAAAADLAALAAASAAAGAGPAAACPAAASVATANGARLVACRTAGETVEVAVRVPLPRQAAALPAPVRRARAGWGADATGDAGGDLRWPP